MKKKAQKQPTKDIKKDKYSETLKINTSFDNAIKTLIAEPKKENNHKH